MKGIITIILISAFLSSCVSQKVIFDKEGKPPIIHSYKNNQNFFMWGILQTKQSSPLYICDSLDNIHTLEVKKGVGNVLSNIVLGGVVQLHIYTPRQSLIYCKKG